MRRVSSEALNWAFKFLGHSPRSESEVRSKLVQLGFPKKVVQATLAKLRSLNILNDEAFARDWARGRVESRGYGPLWVERELGEKGIPEGLIAQVVEEIFGPDGGKERARRLLQKRFGGKDLRDPKTLSRAVALLRRRGYRGSVISELLGVEEDG